MYRRLIAALALLAAGSTAQEAPGIVWSNTYNFSIMTIRQHWNGMLIAGGFSSSGELYWLDMNGTLVRLVSLPGAGYLNAIYDLEILPDGDVIAAGQSIINSDVYTTALFFARLTENGDLIWWKSYDRSGTRECAYDVEPLPDGGYALCGITQTPGQNTDGWLLRTDSLGDTLWTMTWGWTWPDTMRSVEFVDGGLSVLACGRLQDSGAWRPHLVRYDMDGGVEWTVFSGYSGGGQDLCPAQPSGFALLSSHTYGYVTFYRIDELGNVLWEAEVAGDYFKQMETIRQTQDGGYLVAGADDYYFDPGYPEDDYNGHLSRYDTYGSPIWIVSLEDVTVYYDAIQLAQGGYVAAGVWAVEGGSLGRITRFEPETGIGVLPGREVGLDLNTAVPNPGCTTFSLSWASVEAGRTSLRFFDLSGRLVDEVDQGTLPSGPHSIIWEAEDLPSGCYLVLLECGGERASSRLVIIR